MRVVILLKQIREKRKLSLDKLAEMTGISKAHLNYIERGEKEPSISILIRIAVALNIDEKDLYEVRK